MEKLYQWQKKWNIPTNVFNDLLLTFGLSFDSSRLSTDSTSERDIQNLVKLEATQKGMRLWRNNVGALKNSQGNFIRYGLANESHALNTIIKSADLIGIKPLTITEDLIGKKIGQFISREIKPANWIYSATSHEKAQFNWIQLVVSLGGDAAFATSQGGL